MTAPFPVSPMFQDTPDATLDAACPLADDGILRDFWYVALPARELTTYLKQARRLNNAANPATL